MQYEKLRSPPCLPPAESPEKPVVIRSKPEERTGNTNGRRGPVSSSSSQAGKIEFLLPLHLSSIQALSRLDDTHPH